MLNQGHWVACMCRGSHFMAHGGVVLRCWCKVPQCQCLSTGRDDKTAWRRMQRLCVP